MTNTASEGHIGARGDTWLSMMGSDASVRSPVRADGTLRQAVAYWPLALLGGGGAAARDTEAAGGAR